MTTTAPINETNDPAPGSPGRRWLDVALDSEYSPDSLAQLAAAATGILAVVVKRDEAESQADDDSALVTQLDEELAAARQLAAFLEQQVDARQTKIDAALAAMRKSTAKLSNELRAILETPAPPTTDPSPEAPPEPATDDPGPSLEEPARDAPLEDWREYARARGFQDVDGANRSQIRTLLGLPHTDQA